VKFYNAQGKTQVHFAKHSFSQKIRNSSYATAW